jgi:hypothetical protein
LDVLLSKQGNIYNNKQATNQNFFAPIHVSHGMVVVVVVVVVEVPSGFLGHTKDRVPGGKSVQR